MSENPWREVPRRGGRPSSASPPPNYARAVAQGPPSSNTRFQARNFAARQSSNVNRYIPEHLDLDQESVSNYSGQASPDRSQQLSQSNVQSFASQSTPNTSTNQSMPSTSPPEFAPSPTSAFSTHVSNASSSQYGDDQRGDLATGTANTMSHSSPHRSTTSTSNDESTPGVSSESTSSLLDESLAIPDGCAELLEPPKDPFKQLYDTFHQFQSQVLEQMKNTNSRIGTLGDEMATLQKAASRIDPNIFGRSSPPPPQELHRVNEHSPQESQETGISYSPPNQDKNLSNNLQNQALRMDVTHDKNSSNDPVPVSVSEKVPPSVPLQHLDQHPRHDENTNPSMTKLIPSQVSQLGKSIGTVSPPISNHVINDFANNGPQKVSHHQYVPPVYQPPPSNSRPAPIVPQDSTSSSAPSIYTAVKHEPSDAPTHAHPNGSAYRRPSPTLSNATTSSTTEKSVRFNSNEFYLIISDLRDIKYDKMDAFLTKRTLENDTYEALESLYNGIIRGVGVALSSALTFVPSFRELNRSLEFFKLFLHNLHGLPYSKALSIYDTLGQHIKDRLRSTECIDPIKSPKAYDVIMAHPHVGGWSLLQLLIKKRVVACGALPDRDLFITLKLIYFQDQESLQSFYRRLQHVANEFYLMLQNTPHLIPELNILLRFVTELKRAYEYDGHLHRIHEDLLQYKQQFGDIVIGDQLPHTLSSIYEHLILCDVPAVPRGRLRPTRNEMPTIDQTPFNVQSTSNEGGNSATSPSISVQNVLPPPSYESIFDNNIMPQPSISHQEIDPPTTEEGFHVDDWYTSEDVDEINNTENLLPLLAAMSRRRQKKFCQACLTAGHDSETCFLRGPNFCPKELSQRIKVFNQQHGDKPKEGTVTPKWNPRTPPPLLDNNKNTNNTDRSTGGNRGQSSLSSNRQQAHQKRTRPFTNTPTKSVVTKPSVNATNVDNLDSPEHQTSLHPSLSAFITQQDEYIDKMEVDSMLLDDDFDRVVIAMLQSSNSSQRNKKLAYDFVSPFREDHCFCNDTPSEITRQIQLSHRLRPNNPSAPYFKQYAKNLYDLPICNFNTVCKLQFQVDSGANVFSVYSRNLLIAFFETRTEVEAVHGEHFISNGWGIALVLMNGKPTLLAPVYECPDNPRNTFSPGALKKYSCFRHVLVDCHSTMTMTDENNDSFSLLMSEHNGLDFVDFELLTFSDAMIFDPHNNDYRRLTHGDDNMGGFYSSISHLNLPNLQSRSNLFVLPVAAMNLIAYFYVNLFQDAKSRRRAIQTFNKLLHPEHPPSYFASLAPASESLAPSVSAFDTINNTPDTTIIPILAKMYRRVLKAKSDSTVNYMLLHLLFQHSSQDQVLTMCKKKCFTDMPDVSEMKNLICQCAICLLAKSRKLPRGKLVDKTILEPFKSLHIDFAFYTEVSIRGFTANLTIVCSSTSYPFVYATKSKTTPLRLLEWFITTIRKAGGEVCFVRVDEDGALARCSHFCALLVKLGIIMQTTGGYNSTNNGMAERAHGTLADMVRASLYNAKTIIGDQLPPNLPIQKFWCFALHHACYTLRRRYNRMRDTTPYFLVHGQLPSMNDLVIWFSRIVLMNVGNTKMKKLSMERSEFAYFLSFGNNVSNILCWKPSSPFTFYRVNQAVIDDVWTLNKLKSQFEILSSKQSVPTTIDLTKSDDFVDLLPLQDGPFRLDEIRSCTFQLPKSGERIGLQLIDDDIYNLPYIKTTHPGTAAYDGIPSTYRQNSFLVNINGDGPLNSSFAVSMLQAAQNTNDRMVTLDLVKRPSEANQTSLSVTRAMFDQMPDLSKPKQPRPIMNSIEPIVPESHAHFITSASKPDKPTDIFSLLKGPFREQWIAACKVAYHKNRQVGVFALPIPRKSLPPDTRVFKTKLVPEYKPTDVPTVYECKIRDCTVGTGQIKGIDFPESYCPTTDNVSWKLVFVVTAIIRNILAVMDMKNAFQCSIAKPEFRIFVTCPPFFLQWLCETEDFTYEEGVQYVRQMLNGNQGTKAASNIWYNLVAPILIKYGFAKSTVDHAFFVKKYDGPDGTPRWFYICLATDDLLCSFPSYAIFDNFKAYMEEHFKLTVQTGKILTFLGMRIIQTDLGISCDQAEYLFDLVYAQYGRAIEHLKTATTPARYDNQYELDLYNSPPLSDEELREYSIKYKGGFRHHTGKFNHAVCGTRGDMKYALQRLSEYNNKPTAAAFEGISHLYRYIAGDLLRPLFFPAGNIEDHCRLTYFDGDKDIPPISMSNELQLYSDAELARNLSDRRSYLCNVIMLMNVCISIKMEKSSTIMTHTTDSETKATFTGIRRLLPIRRLLEFMGFPCLNPTTANLDNAALQAIITAERMTPRSRHLDIPIAYLHEHHNKTFVPRLIRTYYMLADIGTKPLGTMLHRRFKYWLLGAQFYPVPETEHYVLLEMDLYEQNYIVIVRKYFG